MPRRGEMKLWITTTLAMIDGMIKPTTMAKSDSASVQKLAKSRYSAWIFLALLIVFSILVGLFIFAQNLFDHAHIRGQFLSKISNWTGGEVTASGPIKFSYFPELKVTLEEVQSSQADAPIGLKAKSIDVAISLWPVFVGKIEASSLRLNDAEIMLRAIGFNTLKQRWSSNAIGTSVVEATRQVAADISTPNLSTIANEKIGKIELVHSRILIQSPNGTHENLENVNGSLGWPNLHSSAVVRATAEWRGEPVQFDVHIASPLLFLAGSNSDLNIAISSEPMNLEFEGKSNLVANFYANGNVSWKTPSMRRFLTWARASSTAGEAIGSIELTAELTTKEGKLLFDNVAMVVQESTATGAFEIDPFVKPIKTSGTLAFKKVDLQALATALPIGVEKSRSDELHLLDDLNLDLRLSAEQAILSGYLIANAAGAVRISKGDASIDLGTGDYAGGTIMGRLELTGPSTAKSGRLSASINNIHQDQLVDLPSGIPIIAGPISGKFDISGAYADLRSLIKNGDGSITLTLGAGVIRNFNIETMQAAIAEKRVFELPTVFAGMSEARALNLSANIKNGVVAIDTARATIDGRIVTLSGAFPLLSPAIAFHGMIVQEVETETSKQMPFFLGGTWKRPLIMTLSAQ